MELRSEIKQLTQTAGMSVRQLSSASGVRRQSIMHFLTGGNIHLANLEKLLSALGYGIVFSKISPVAPAKSLLQGRVSAVPDEIAKFCKENGIKSLSLFGSILSTSFTKDSDIDVLIELEKSISLFDLADLEEGLKKLFRTTRKLDVVTKKSISPLILNEMMRSKSYEVLYEKT